MSYIGNQPSSVAFLTDTFSGNASATSFTLSAAPASTSSIIVAVSGVLQDPSTYAVTGTTLNFSGAPPSGTGNISVRFLGIPASGVTTTAYRTVTEFTATAAQTTFSVPSYTVGFIDVYRNGVMLGSADYTATNGTTVVLATGATSGDLIEVISFSVSSVLNAIPASPASVQTSYLVDGAVTAAKLGTTGSASSSTYLRGDMAWSALPASGKLLQVVSATKTNGFSTAGSTGTFVDITGLSVSITPSSASNKILIIGHSTVSTSSTGYRSAFRIVRDSTAICVGDANGSRIRSTVGGQQIAATSEQDSVAFNFLDSPATTSATTYKIQICGESGTTYYVNEPGNASTGSDQYTSTSTITVMEIAG